MRVLALLISSLLLTIGSSMAQLVLLDQVQNQSNQSITTQTFETVLQNFNAMGAEDIFVPAGDLWHLDSMVIFGEYWSLTGPPDSTSGIIVHVYTDNSGLPGALLFADTILSGSDPEGDGTLKMSWPDPLVLNPGNYWIAASAKKEFYPSESQWQWFTSVSGEGDTALWQNPGDGFLLIPCEDWSNINTCLGSSNTALSLKLYGCNTWKPEIFDLPEDTAFCEGGMFNLQIGTNASVAAVLWSNGQSGTTLTTDSSGLFVVTVTDAATGCSVHDTVHISTTATPNPELPQNIGVCKGDTITIHAQVCPQCEALWNTGWIGNQLEVWDSGQYTVQVFDTISGCVGFDTTAAHYWPKQLLKILPESYIEACEGDTVVLSTEIIFSQYDWAGISSAEQVLITTDISGILSAVDSNGCAADTTFKVVFHPNPQPVIINKFEDGKFVLTAGDYWGYWWSSGQTDSSILVDGGTYSVTVTDTNGCIGTATIDLPLGWTENVDNQWMIYPNPVEEILYVNTELFFYQYKILSLEGSIIRRGSITNESGSIEMGDLPTGHYFLQLQNHEKLKTLSFVKL